MSYYLKQKKILTNLIIMSNIWLASAFGYYLILSLVNTFEEVYFTGLTSSFSEIVAFILSGLFYEKIGVKLTLITSLLISTFGGVMIIVWGL